MSFYLNDEYCTDHYLAGLLLREVSWFFNTMYMCMRMHLQLEAALKSQNIQVRSKAIKMVRNVLAKIDSDDRYTDQVRERGKERERERERGRKMIESICHVIFL